MSDTDEVEGRDRSLIFWKGEREKPVKFYFHRSVTVGQQQSLEKAITDNGGATCDEEHDADTILVHYESLDVVRKRYDHSKSVYVEDLEFVKRCIRRKAYYHDKPVKKSLGGRPVGTHRVEFIPEDDSHLAEYMASRLPDPESGARQGNNVYKQLCDDVYEDDYPWAKRHTWQSWRNRYKTNMARIDAMIEAYLRHNPRHPDGKGEYPHDRRAVGLGRRARHRHLNARRLSNSSEEEEREEENERAEIEASNDERRRKRRRTHMPTSEDPSTPEQVRQGQNRSMSIGEDAAEESLKLLDETDFMRVSQDFNNNFDNDDINLQTEWSPPPEAIPNTQATLVQTQAQHQGAAKGDVPVSVSSSLSSSARRMAARNRDRSASAKFGATGRTFAPPSSMPMDTQATVVATQAPSRLPTQTQPRADINHEGDLGVTGNTSSVQRLSISQPPASGPARTSVDSNAMRRPQPRPKPRTAIKRVFPASSTSQIQQRTVEEDAPYQHTRSRSRSVEPEIMPPPAVPASRMRQRKTAMLDIEEQKEMDADADAEEEIKVEDAYDEQRSLEAVENTLAVVEVEEEEEEEEEDEGGDLASGSHAESAYILERARRLKQTSLNTLEGTPMRPPGASFENRSLSALQSRFKATPRQEESSESDFPTAGTRAKETRKRREQIEKVEPYTPTPGSRAEEARAALALEQEVRRKRARRH